MNEYMIELDVFEGLKRAITLFRVLEILTFKYFRNSFCYVNIWGFKSNILGHVCPLGKTLIFLSPLGSLKFWDFLSFLFISKLSCSKPFHNTLNCASTANIEEVMKFYNLGDKTFETDFNCLHSYPGDWPVKALQLASLCILSLQRQAE